MRSTGPKATYCENLLQMLWFMSRTSWIGKGVSPLDNIPRSTSLQVATQSVPRGNLNPSSSNSPLSVVERRYERNLKLPVHRKKQTHYAFYVCCCCYIDSLRCAEFFVHQQKRCRGMHLPMIHWKEEGSLNLCLPATSYYRLENCLDMQI